jgi:hypothetical protein
MQLVCSRRQASAAARRCHINRPRHRCTTRTRGASSSQFMQRAQHSRAGGEPHAAGCAAWPKLVGLAASNFKIGADFAFASPVLHSYPRSNHPSLPTNVVSASFLLFLSVPSSHLHLQVVYTGCVSDGFFLVGAEASSGSRTLGRRAATLPSSTKLIYISTTYFRRR